MDVYFEQSVDNPNIDKHSKRTRVLGILRYVCIVAVILIAMFGLMFMPVGKEGNVDGMTILWSIIYLIFSIAPFVATFLLLGRFIARSNLEYDYYLNGSMFRIVKVVNRKKRKKMLETQVSGFESLGAIQSETYDRYASSKEIKKLYAMTDYENEARVYYIYYVSDGVRYLLHFTPNNDMIMALRKSVTRITILDKSFKTYEVEDESVLG